MTKESVTTVFIYRAIFIVLAARSITSVFHLWVVGVKLLSAEFAAVFVTAVAKVSVIPEFKIITTCHGQFLLLYYYDYFYIWCTHSQ